MARQDKFSNEYRTLVDALTERRRSAGLTQVELAKTLGVDQSRISKFERRERQIGVVDYVKLCAAIGIDAGALLRLIFSPKRRTAHQAAAGKRR